MKTASELALTIERFLDGSGGVYEWDDALQGDLLKDIKAFCSGAQEYFPSGDPNVYTSDEGERVLARLAVELRRGVDHAREYIAGLDVNH